ncbi:MULTISPECIES: hypothetical protein [Streptomyces violaceusniger group]|nr:MULTISPECIES: hypothetical protein [Streptomyces violaceusniger group]
MSKRLHVGNPSYQTTKEDLEKAGLPGDERTVRHRHRGTGRFARRAVSERYGGGRASVRLSSSSAWGWFVAITKYGVECDEWIGNKSPPASKYLLWGKCLQAVADGRVCPDD